MMNEKQMKNLLDSVILLSETIDTLKTKNTTREVVAYDKVKRVFLNLMELTIYPHDQVEVYEFDNEKDSFGGIKI